VKVASIWVGKGRVKWADDGAHEYTRRLPRHLGFQEISLKPSPFKGDVDAVKNAEADRILAKLSDSDRLIALDERGIDLDSHGFADLIDQAAKLGTKRLVFAIGGPYGHGPAVRDRAWKTLRLSKMVLNHSLARVVLGEQLYRASTILWGGQYHH
jgi:23S rRNA (pseudouridine1915-N3)-methyltransferase